MDKCVHKLDKPPVNFFLYFLDLCALVWILVVVVRAVQFSEHGFNDSDPTSKGSNTTAGSDRTIQIQSKVASANVPFKKQPELTFGDILSGDTLDMAPSALAYGISKGVDKYGNYDVKFGTKSHKNQLYIPWNYDDNYAVNSIATIKDIESDVIFSEHWANQTWGTHIYVGEDLDMISAKAVVNITFTEVVDCTLKLSVGSLINIKAPGTLTFNGTLDGTIKVELTDPTIHEESSEKWRFEATTATFAHFRVGSVHLLEAEFDDCEFYGYDVCQYATDGLIELFESSDLDDSLNKEIENVVKEKIDDYLGETFKYTFSDGAFDMVCDHLKCDEVNDLGEIVVKAANEAQVIAVFLLIACIWLPLRMCLLLYLRVLSAPVTDQDAVDSNVQNQGTNGLNTEDAAAEPSVVAVEIEMSNPPTSFPGAMTTLSSSSKYTTEL